MSRKTHLKIKVRTLALEASIIRAEERKALKNPKLWSRFDWDDTWKSVPCTPQDSGATNSSYESLRLHRITVVRQAARLNHLAYGFLRGTSYARMEGSCKTPPDWAKVEKIAKRFGPNEWSERWSTWLAEAQAHLAPREAA